MDQSARGAFVPVGTPLLCDGGDDFRTRAARFLMDPVLPAIMLLVIATLTVAIIVLLVTTVATAVLHAQPELGNVVDPLAGPSSNSAALYEDDFLYPGDALGGDEMARAGFWASSRLNDRYDDAPLARGNP